MATASPSLSEEDECTVPATYHLATAPEPDVEEVGALCVHDVVVGGRSVTTASTEAKTQRKRQLIQRGSRLEPLVLPPSSSLDANEFSDPCTWRRSDQRTGASLTHLRTRRRTAKAKSCRSKTWWIPLRTRTPAREAAVSIGGLVNCQRQVEAQGSRLRHAHRRLRVSNNPLELVDSRRHHQLLSKREHVPPAK